MRSGMVKPGASAAPAAHSKHDKDNKDKARHKETVKHHELRMLFGFI